MELELRTQITSARVTVHFFMFTSELIHLHKLCRCCDVDVPWSQTQGKVANRIMYIHTDEIIVKVYARLTE